jgi:Mg/Co/Ni transporter MgtE
MVFLVDESGKLRGSVPLGRLSVAGPEKPLTELTTDNLIYARVGDKEEKVLEQFDKYNLLSLPVLDGEGSLVGVITADDVISVLRQR